MPKEKLLWPCSTGDSYENSAMAVTMEAKPDVTRQGGEQSVLKALPHNIQLLKEGTAQHASIWEEFLYGRMFFKWKGKFPEVIYSKVI